MKKKERSIKTIAVVVALGLSNPMTTLASDGINQVLPFFITPSIRPSAQSTPIRLEEIFHTSDISTVVKYSILFTSSTS